jgi:hypothetical protein
MSKVIQAWDEGAVLRNVVDPGVSALKIITADSKGRVGYLSVSPYCTKINREIAKERTKQWGVLGIENAWVGDFEGCYLIGESAKEYDDVPLGNNERKYEKAKYKALAVLGHLSERLNIPNHTKVNMAVLLPFDEYVNKGAFIDEFQFSIEQFDYCGVEKGFKLDSISVRPEGSGAFLYGVPKGVSRDGLFGSLVIGFRNASFLVTRDQKPDIENSTTSNLGFRWLVSKLKAATGLKDELAIAEYLCCESEPESKARAKEWREVLAVAPAHEEMYWQQLADWIDKQVSCKSIVCSGGTALRYRHRLEALLGSRLIWPDALHEKILKSVPEPYEAFRYLDPTGIFESLKK